MTPSYADLPPKDREVNGKAWPMTLRRRYAEAANRALQSAGIAKRYDHRSYKEMGIDTGARSRLPPGIAHLERKGNPTELGELGSLVATSEAATRALVTYADQVRRAEQHWQDIAHLAEAKPLIAQFIRHRTESAALRRDKALYYDYFKTAMSRPTARKHLFTRERAKIDQDMTTRNRLGRLRGLDRKLRAVETEMTEIRQELAPLEQAFRDRELLLASGQPEHQAVTGKLEALRKARRQRETAADVQ